MITNYGYALIAALFTVTPKKINSTNDRSENVILLMIDGFANYYLNKTGLTGFRTMAEHGTVAEYNQPDFPTLSFPNWYTISTGEYKLHQV